MDSKYRFWIGILYNYDYFMDRYAVFFAVLAV